MSRRATLVAILLFNNAQPIDALTVATKEPSK